RLHPRPQPRSPRARARRLRSSLRRPAPLGDVPALDPHLPNRRAPRTGAGRRRRGAPLRRLVAQRRPDRLCARRKRAGAPFRLRLRHAARPRRVRRGKVPGRVVRRRERLVRPAGVLPAARLAGAPRLLADPPHAEGVRPRQPARPRGRGRPLLPPDTPMNAAVLLRLVRLAALTRYAAAVGAAVWVVAVAVLRPAPFAVEWGRLLLLLAPLVLVPLGLRL